MLLLPVALREQQQHQRVWLLLTRATADHAPANDIAEGIAPRCRAHKRLDNGVRGHDTSARYHRQWRSNDIAEGIAPRCRARDHCAETLFPRTPRRWRSRTRYLGAVSPRASRRGVMPAITAPRCRARERLGDGVRGHDTSARYHRQWRSRERCLGAVPSTMALAGTIHRCDAIGDGVRARQDTSAGHPRRWR